MNKTTISMSSNREARIMAENMAAFKENVPEYTSASLFT
jgi:hypothetical protein